jgi:hypothetical protein
MKYKNPWKEDSYFELDNPIYEKGDFKIYKQFDKCYLHTYKNIAFNQLLAPNKELIDWHIKGIRPDVNPLGFIYDVGRRTMERQLGKIINNSPRQLDIFDCGA